MNPFERLESEVRTYSRAFPAVFDRAEGALLFDEEGNRYIDFFAGAGVLNYGHNNPLINAALVDYLSDNRVLHSLDMFTKAKRGFLEALESRVFAPRGMEYRVQFCGPTGTNAVEAALKLARQVKGRRGVIAFTHAFHGLTAGALGATGNAHYHSEFYPCDLDVTFMPYDGYLGPDVDTAEVLRTYLVDNSSGVRVPAAIILETIQAEGGVNVASEAWLRKVADICREFDIVLIVDEIQVGNGRSGWYFSFERAGIQPDLVVVSKALGAGLPMAVVLIRPDLDLWKPGQHTGTFRGNNLAFVGATTALEEYWKTEEFAQSVRGKGAHLRELLEGVRSRWPEPISEVRGCGLIQGVVFQQEGVAAEVSREAFNRGVVIELSGARDEVLKFLPPLVIESGLLEEGVGIVEEAIEAVVQDRGE